LKIYTINLYVNDNNDSMKTDLDLSPSVSAWQCCRWAVTSCMGKQTVCFQGNLCVHIQTTIQICVKDTISQQHYKVHATLMYHTHQFWGCNVNGMLVLCLLSETIVHLFFPFKCLSCCWNISIEA
jgi:hypothetical protein